MAFSFIVPPLQDTTIHHCEPRFTPLWKPIHGHTTFVVVVTIKTRPPRNTRAFVNHVYRDMANKSNVTEEQNPVSVTNHLRPKQPQRHSFLTIILFLQSKSLQITKRKPRSALRLVLVSHHEQFHLSRGSIETYENQKPNGRASQHHRDLLRTNFSTYKKYETTTQHLRTRISQATMPPTSWTHNKILILDERWSWHVSVSH